MVQEKAAIWRAMTPGQWPAETLPSGRATNPTPTRPMRVPIQTRRVQGSPPGRRPSSSSIHRGTVATMRAAMPLGMVRSDHITRPLPTDRSSTPMKA